MNMRSTTWTAEAEAGVADWSYFYFLVLYSLFGFQLVVLIIFSIMAVVTAGGRGGLEKGCIADFSPRHIFKLRAKTVSLQGQAARNLLSAGDP